MILRDSVSFDVDAVLDVKIADPYDVQEMINDIKEKWIDEDSPDDLLSRIEEELPDNCQILNEWHTLWY